MNLRQLGYFCEIVEAGSAAQAAARLHVAPTAISMQLAQLEAIVGGQLLDRATRPMRLTPLGTFFHPRAVELLAQARRLGQDASRVARARDGWLGIGFTRSAIFSILPIAVRRFREAWPDVRIELVELLTEHQAAQLAAGKIHVGIARFIGPAEQAAGVRCTTLLEEPLVAAVPADHPFARRSSLSVAELSSMPFISYPKEPATQFGMQVLALLEQAGALPTVGYEAQEIHTALGLAAAGLGFTMVGRSTGWQNRSDVAFIAIDDFPATSTIAALTREVQTNAFVPSFLEALQG